jgi:hypothetical protein
VKKIVMAIAILIIMPALIGISHIYLNKASTEMAQKLSVAEDSARKGDISLSLKQLNEFSKDWDFNKKIFATFIRHAELDLANQSSAKLIPYLQDDNKSNFYGECETLKMQINHIADTERFSVDNIL